MKRVHGWLGALAVVSFVLFTLPGCGGGDGGGYSGGKGSGTKSGTSGGTKKSGTAKTGGAGDKKGGSGASSGEPGFGDLTMRFVYDGDAPAQQKINVTKDVEYCGPKMPLDETLVVDPDTKGIANVFVYLYLGSNDTPPEPHPSYAETADAKVLLDNIGCRFEPRACVLRTGQTLVVGNDDEVGHNTKAEFLENNSFNDLIPAKSKMEKTDLSKPERLPSPVNCSIHPWMSAKLLITDTPYAAVSGKDGSITIKNIPTGTWTFQVWHETANYVADVSIDGKTTEWRRGRFEQTIEVGDNDLGDILIKPSAFGK